MADAETYREAGAIRVLFCLGVMPEFFATDPTKLGPLIEGFTKAFEDLSGRFDVRVLGTMDDDATMVGPSLTYPWTAYILAEAPDHGAVAAVCNILRETEIGDGDRLWRYLKVEARVGRPLFFGNE